MAGLGFKDFQVGEVLTSSDVDGYLMQQTVMRFADAGARGSALGTAPGTAVALAEGMVSYLDDANAVQVFDGSAWLNVGRILQVVSFVKTDTQTVSGSGTSTYAKIGGGTNDLEVTITPSSSSSKVLVFAQVVCAQAIGGIADEHTMFSLFRDSTNLANPSSAGNRTPSLSGTNQNAMIAGSRGAGSFTMMYLDSPATTSAVTYSAQHARATSGTTYFNRSVGDADFNYVIRGVSFIVGIEVAG